MPAIILLPFRILYNKFYGYKEAQKEEGGYL
jgi:hypothetical protein